MKKCCIFGSCIGCGFCYRKDTITQQARTAAVVTGNLTIDRINYKAELAKAEISFVNEKAAEHDRKIKKARRKSNNNLRKNNRVLKVPDVG